MRRPVSAKTTKKHLTKKEKEIRLSVENAFVDNGAVDPPQYLTVEQLEIFNFIVSALKAANVLSSLDAVTIAQASVNISMLHNSNRQVALNPDLSYDVKFVSTNEKLVRTYLKLCDELCLSPASRAKMGALIANKKEEAEDPLLNVLQGGKSS